MVLSIISLEDKHKMLLYLSIFYEYQQFFQHHICFSIQPPDYSDPWPTLARSTSFFLIMLFNNKCLCQILVNEDRSICLPIVGEISVNDFPTVCHLFYYYLISWLTLNSVNWNSLGLLINCYDYVNNNQDYIFFNFHCLKLQHMSKISIITLTPKQSF